ncbi:MAG TPA: hypothetical protein VFQ38_06120 [Longimicrobiales bacterium]|nr:hypothetical protein [Longimicrobiales bacterium]
MPTQMSIDTDVYLFLADVGVYHDDVVISAHGGYQAKNTPEFAVPTQGSFEGLYFYVPHGSLQTDFGLGGFAGQERAAVEHLEPGRKCFDYELSKYQGRHNKAGETYDTIMRDMAAASEALTKYNTGLAKAPKVYAAKTRPRQFDVVTIRNRFRSGDVQLGDLVTRLLNQHDYKRIHCYFCRGAM